MNEKETPTKVLIDREKKQKRTVELAQEIAGDYRGKRAVLIVMLKGATSFATHLKEAAYDFGLTDIETDYMGVSSYAGGTNSSREPKITKDLETNIHGRHVLIVEDIIDTGYSLNTLLQILKARNPASIEIVTLLSKPSRREISVHVKYVGFEIDDKFVVGAGMDLNQLYRDNPDIVYFP